MIRTLTAPTLLAGAVLFASTAATAQTAPEVTLTRLDCGTQVVNDISVRVTDTFADPGQLPSFPGATLLIGKGDRDGKRSQAPSLRP